MEKILYSTIGNQPRHYKHEGVKVDKIEIWEDGIRTLNKPDCFEWWYFDSILEDGSTLVIVFYTKSMIAPTPELAPYATCQFDTPDGRHYYETVKIPADMFYASDQSCDIKIGECTIKGDLHQYDIRFKNENIEAVVTLTGDTPAWRVASGGIFFGDNDEYYASWLPAVPSGTVTAKITADGKTTEYSGTGYRDHNWGNAPLLKLLNHWYWGRARIGQYRVITSYMYAEKEYGYNQFPIFMLAKDGEILTHDSEKYVTFTASDVVMNETTGKPIHNKLIYDYNDGQKHYRVTFERQENIVESIMVDRLPQAQKIAAKKAGFDGCYIRSKIIATVEEFEGDTVIEKESAPAISEMMYFGKVVDALYK